MVGVTLPRGEGGELSPIVYIGTRRERMPMTKNLKLT